MLADITPTENKGTDKENSWHVNFPSFDMTSHATAFGQSGNIGYTPKSGNAWELT